MIFSRFTMRISTPYHLAVALVVALTLPLTNAWHKGIVFGSDEWSNPQYSFNSNGAIESLTALKETGADHVRIIFTQFTTSINTTTIYPIESPSALASSTLANIEFIINYSITNLQLDVVLCPIIDPNWDFPLINGRSIGDNNFDSRLQQGLNYTENDWQLFFQSYQNYITPYVTLAEKYHVSLFEMGSELDIAFTTRGNDWLNLITFVRSIYKGPLSAAMSADTISNNEVPWVSALDYIGIDTYYSLGSNVPLGIAPSVDSLVLAWQPILDKLQQIFLTYNKSIIITEIGYQSRPSCHVRPWGTVDRDPLDDSAWLQDHDCACQANAYEAFFQAVTARSFFAGVYWWLWRTDPSAGGTGDSDFTPHGKPAEIVLRRWYGNYTCSNTSFYQQYIRNDGTFEMTPTEKSIISSSSSSTPLHRYYLTPSDNACDGSFRVIEGLRSSTRTFIEEAAIKYPRTPGINITKKQFNGFCFGGPDEWSSPYYRFDSTGAEQSIENLLQIGTDTVEVIVQWYFSNVTSTEIYPILDPDNPLRTSTDDELKSILVYAKSRGMKTLLTPMLDPDWTLPAQNFCRGETGKNGCYWRGQLGMYWNQTDCSPESDYGQWFAGYKPVLIHYAQLAEATDTDGYLIAHELATPVSACPNLWADIVTEVRAVFGGQVSSAFLPNLLDPNQLNLVLPWAKTLDFIGIDCYLNYNLPKPPAVPWQDTNLSIIENGVQSYVNSFSQLAQTTGKKVVCTEVGWASRPWTYTGTAGIAKLDPEDCSVWDQCVSMNAHVLIYQAFMETFYAQDWFDGVLFWTARADPTAGGTSDDGFTVIGKPSAGVIANYWLL